MSRDIDETLRLRRERLDRDISAYRALALGLAVGTTMINHLRLGRGSWVPTAYFAVWATLAAGQWAWARRGGVSRAWQLVFVAFDMVIVTGLNPLLAWTGQTPAENTLAFTAWVSGPAVMLILLINLARQSRPAARAPATWPGPASMAASHWPSVRSR